MRTDMRGEPLIGTWFRRLATDSVEASDSLGSVLGVERRLESVSSWERFLDLFDPADRDRLRELCRGEASAEGTEARFRVVGDDEQTRAVRIQTRTICGAEGRHEGVLGIVIDVSERPDVDRETAHELRNQLMVVFGNLDLVQMRTTAGTELARYVALALQSAERCAELTEQILGKCPDRRSQ